MAGPAQQSPAPETSLGPWRLVGLVGWLGAQGVQPESGPQVIGITTVRVLEVVAAEGSKTSKQLDTTAKYRRGCAKSGFAGVSEVRMPRQGTDHTEKFVGDRDEFWQ